jgi:hypothetical protein
VQQKINEQKHPIPDLKEDSFSDKQKKLKLKDGRTLEQVNNASINHEKHLDSISRCGFLSVARR